MSIYLTYVKEVISMLIKVCFRQKRPLGIQKSFYSFMPPTAGSKGVSYYFTSILLMKGSHLCLWKLLTHLSRLK